MLSGVNSISGQACKPLARHGTPQAETTKQPMPFNCDSGEEKRWNPLKKDWCCKTQEKACQVYNCLGAFDSSWTHDHKLWCCKHLRIGCTTTTIIETTISTTTTSSMYSCQNPHTADWPPSQKSWCCEHAGKGCEGCDTPCNIKNYEASCRNRVQWDQENQQETLGASEPCAMVFNETLAKCPVCKVCQVLDICPPASTTTTISTTFTTTEMYDCNYGLPTFELTWSSTKKLYCCERHSKGCADSDTTTTTDVTTSRATTSSATEKLRTSPNVRRNIATTTLASVKSTTTVVELFACDATTDADTLSWSDFRKAYCCKRHHRGCPTDAPPSTTRTNTDSTDESYDCAAGLGHWQLGWSSLKKEFCCKTIGKGCEKAGTSQPFDCEAGYGRWRVGWSFEKMAWCCVHHQKGCQDREPQQKASTTTREPYDCEEGSGFGEEMDVDKIAYCCKTYKRGCQVANTEPYDCAAKFHTWQQDWSYRKKRYCCDHYNRGCAQAAQAAQISTTTSEPYNCAVAYNNWHAAWSSAKKSWCCRLYFRGCPLPVQRKFGEQLQHAFLGEAEERGVWKRPVAVVIAVGCFITLILSVRTVSARDRSFRPVDMWSTSLEFAADGEMAEAALE